MKQFRIVGGYDPNREQQTLSFSIGITTENYPVRIYADESFDLQYFYNPTWMEEAKWASALFYMQTNKPEIIAEASKLFGKMQSLPIVVDDIAGFLKRKGYVQVFEDFASLQLEGYPQPKSYIFHYTEEDAKKGDWGWLWIDYDRENYCINEAVIATDIADAYERLKKRGYGTYRLEKLRLEKHPVQFKEYYSLKQRMTIPEKVCDK